MASTRLLIAPEGALTATEQVHFLRLPHPRNSLPALFLPQQGVDGTDSLLEVQAISPEDSAKRSWFVGESVVSGISFLLGDITKKADGKLFLLTPFDAAFLIIAILEIATAPVQDGGIYRALPYSDIFEEAADRLNQTNEKEERVPANDETHNNNRDLEKFGEMHCARQAIEAICDIEEAGDLKAFRLSEAKIVALLRQKIDKITTDEAFSNTAFPSLAHLAAKEVFDKDDNTLRDIVIQARQKVALDIVGYYVPDPFDQALRATYQFTDLEAHVLAREASRDLASHMPGFKAAAPGSSNNRWTKNKNGKKEIAGNGKPLQKKNVTAPKGSQGVEALKKASKVGMSPLTTFFAKVDKS